MRVTIKDIAKRLGLSACTVSNALNATGRVGDGRKAQILTAADEMGYISNKNARNLIKQVHGKIGLYAPSLGYIRSSLFFSELCAGLLSGLSAAGTQLIIVNSENSMSKKYDFDLDVDCAVILEPEDSGEYLDMIHSARVPIILIGRPAVTDERMNYIDADNFKTGYLVMCRTLDAGYTRPLMITGPTRLTITVDILAGFKKALTEAGLPFVRDDVIIAEYSRYNDDFTELKTRLRDGCAVICSSDIQAVNALSACRQLRKRVPDDVSLLCLNNSPLTEMYEPPLSGARVNAFEMGVEAARIFGQMTVRNGTAEHKIFDGTLIVGASVKPCKKPI